MNCKLRRLPVVISALCVTLYGYFPSLAAPESAPTRVVRTFSAGAREAVYDTHRFLLGPEIVADDRDGTLRLAGSVLVAHEMGATDFHQGEALTERVQVKKVFALDSSQVRNAELFFFGSAERVRINGMEVSAPERLVSTGWSRVAIAPELLRTGDNEVILSGRGQLLLEPGRASGRSFKSTDGGRTWSNAALGTKGTQQGEYLVRLRLGRFASRGAALSQVLDLWAAHPRVIGTPGRVLSFQALADLSRGQPAGTQLMASLRTGSTPAPDDKTWTGWINLDRDYHPPVPADRHRWAQLKFELATSRPQATPRLPARFDLALTFQADDFPSAGASIVRRDEAPVRVGATTFVYQEPSPRLKLLRDRYHLDQVIEPGKTEMEQLMLLRTWVRNQWHTAWGSHPANWMPPWDALIILESKDQPDCLTMCTHYAAVFTQCCLALGWNARHCILDHHCVAEVYVNQHRKWVMMDAGNSSRRADVGLHFERNGVPLSARELHLAQRTGQTGGITVHFTPARLAAAIAALCRPAPAAGTKTPPRPDVIPLAALGQYPVCQLENYRRYAFPARNNYLGSPLPGELCQGWSEYFYDGYCWVGDDGDAPRLSPEYSRHLAPSRPQDVDWSLNWTRIHLAHTARPGVLRVDLETQTPNLARLEKRQGKEGDAWQPAAASYLWQLRPGSNALMVRGVNRWDRAGAETGVTVSWTPSP